jgi:hypothetical protein
MAAMRTSSLRLPRNVLGRWLALGLLAMLAPLGASCGDADPYDTTCSADGDCVVVEVGRGCGCTNCRRTVINSGELERYKEDRKDDEIDCQDDDGLEGCTGQPCVEPLPFCSNGKCALR